MTEPKAHELLNIYDYDGACKPYPGEQPAYASEGFSVGVFQWIIKTDGKGLKRGRVIKRIRGMVSNPQEVYDKAEQLCKELNAKGRREHDGKPR